MTTVQELQPGDPIMAWLKLGFALQKDRHPSGSLYRTIPSKPDRFDKDDLQQFIGMVTQNDTVQHILTVETSRMTSKGRAVEAPIIAQIHYLAFKRLRRISKFAYAPRAENPLRPTYKAKGTDFSGYRTAEDILLTWK